MTERGGDVARAAALLAAGGLVRVPDGDGVRARRRRGCSDDAVGRIFAVEGPAARAPADRAPARRRRRSRTGPLEVPELARRLAAAAWPGPLTLILRARPARRRRGRPAARTPSGCACPRTRWRRRCLARVRRRRGGAEREPVRRGQPDDGRPRGRRSARRRRLRPRRRPVRGRRRVDDRGPLARPPGAAAARRHAARGDRGDLGLAAIGSAFAARSRTRTRAPAAPGTLESHYAPRARGDRRRRSDGVLEQRRGGLARRRGRCSRPPARSRAWPGLRARAHALPDDAAGMARELYGALRELDAAGVDVVIAALPPAAGLGEAVGDRLRRAAGPRAPRAPRRRRPEPLTLRVGIITGSRSDWDTMKHAADVLGGAWASGARCGSSRRTARRICCSSTPRRRRAAGSG